MFCRCPYFALSRLVGVPRIFISCLVDLGKNHFALAFLRLFILVGVPRIFRRFSGRIYFPIFVSSAALYHVLPLKIPKPYSQVACGSDDPRLLLMLQCDSKVIFCIL